MQDDAERLKQDSENLENLASALEAGLVGEHLEPVHIGVPKMGEPFLGALLRGFYSI